MNRGAAALRFADHAGDLRQEAGFEGPEAARVERRLPAQALLEGVGQVVVEEAVAASGGKVDYTAIGSPVVTARMRELCAVFGGEGNGGLVFPRHQFCRDGLMAAAGMLDMLARGGRKLSEIVDALPKFERRKLRIECPEKIKSKAMNLLEKKLGDKITVKVDGLKAVDEEGWALVRPSGTEPIIRIVAESRNARKTEDAVRSLKEQVLAAIDEAGGAETR